MTDGSFDAYSWQLLESKQRFISQLLSGSLTEKEAEDVDSIVLDYAEVKALAIGNPLIKKRVETANELARLLTLHRKAVYIREQLEAELAEIPERLERQRKLYSACLQDVDDYKRLRREYTLEERTALSSAVMEAIAGYDFTEGVEKTIGEYQGFSVVLPSYLIRQKPHVWLKRNGKYKVDIGESVFGVIARLDNALETMDKQLQVYKDNVQSLILSKEEIRQDMHTSDTVQEKLSLVSRFGVTIYFASPNKKELQNIVTVLAKRYGVTMEEEKLLAEANKWELAHGGLSGRTAQQFIDYILGMEEL